MKEFRLARKYVWGGGNTRRPEGRRKDERNKGFGNGAWRSKQWKWMAEFILLALLFFGTLRVLCLLLLESSPCVLVYVALRITGTLLLDDAQLFQRFSKSFGHPGPRGS